MNSIKAQAARAIPARFTWVIAICSAAQLGACTGGGEVSDRPLLGPSVAELHGAQSPDAPGQLDYLDALEKRDLVCNDDALCAVLMLTSKQALPTYQARVGAAKEKGIVDAGYDRPGREAVTAGEVAGMVDRSLGAAASVSDAQAMSDLKAKGVFPAAARTNQGMTGSQLLAVLGSAGDVLRASGPAMENTPQPAAASAERPTTEKDDPDTFVDFGSQDASPAKPAQARKEPAPPPAATAMNRTQEPSSDRPDPAGLPHARSEPLPALAAATPERPGAPNQAPREPDAGAPSGQPPTPPPSPRSGDGSAPGTPVWTPGKPLQKPRPRNQGGGS
jgi:hypothetical protein